MSLNTCCVTATYHRIKYESKKSESNTATDLFEESAGRVSVADVTEGSTHSGSVLSVSSDVKMSLKCLR